jgi:hypothetical protein
MRVNESIIKLMSIKDKMFWQPLVDHIDGLNPVEKLPWKYGSKEAYVFEDLGKHWRVWIYVHREDGWQKQDPIEIESVVLRERVITEWVPE